ncbi:cell shape-determining protein MreC [Chryseobacterium ginsenosidimutans]|nr:cell shape-determining protein MreC [Chryseobacterium ginsenosidimutans]
MPDNKPDTVLFYEWRKIWKDVKQPNLKFSDRINYIFNSPGWRHDGFGKTVKQYQKEHLERQTRKQKQKQSA